MYISLLSSICFYLLLSILFLLRQLIIVLFLVFVGLVFNV